MKVLLIDDDPIILLDMMYELIDYGYYIKITTRPMEALKIYEINKFDAVITDFNMPGINGLDLMKKIREVDQKAKVIIMSGNDDSELVKELLAYGAYGYQKKPFILADLIIMLREIEKDLVNG
jgi:DNA-binding NtrC family response regulator